MECPQTTPTAKAHTRPRLGCRRPLRACQLNESKPREVPKPYFSSPSPCRERTSDSKPSRRRPTSRTRTAEKMAAKERLNGSGHSRGRYPLVSAQERAPPAGSRKAPVMLTGGCSHLEPEIRQEPEIGQSQGGGSGAAQNPPPKLRRQAPHLWGWVLAPGAT